MNARHFIVFAAFVAALAVTGAGCISFGGSKTSSSDGGFYTSTDSGAHFAQQVALPSASGVGSIGQVDVTALALDPSDADAVYLGSLADGVFTSLDGGASWTRPSEDLARSGHVIAVAVDPRNVCTYYVLKPDRLMKTTTCGRTFATGTYVETRSKESLTALALDWYNPNTLWIGTTAGDVIRSTDAGATWSTNERLDSDVSAIAVSGSDSRIILVGTKSHNMVRTTDSGATWTSYQKTLKDFKKSDTVYGFAQTKDGSEIFMSSSYGLLVSKDAGSTWNAVPLVTSSGEVHIYAVAVAPTDANVVYYATDSALYASTSGGASWGTHDSPTSRAAGALLVSPNAKTTLLFGARDVAKK